MSSGFTFTGQPDQPGQPSQPGQPNQPGQPGVPGPPMWAPAPPPQGPQPRRLSVFGGLLWILIGSLLLVNNLVADLRVWDLLRNYWPVLLILLGVVKLFDHFRSQQTGAPPARLVTGGEIFLLIMLFMVGGAIATVHGIKMDNPEFGDIRFPWEEEYTFPEEVSHAAVAARPVRIDIARGDITVVAEDTDQIRTVVNRRARGASEDQARDRMKNTGVEIVEMDNSYVIRRRAGGNEWVRLDLEVHLPRKAALTARTGRGDIHVQGSEADIKVDANGDVEIRDVKGAVEARVDGDAMIFSTSGDVRVDGDCSDIEIADITGGATIRCGFTGRTTVRNVSKQVYFKSVRTEFTAGSLPGRLVIGSGDLELFDAPKDVTLVTRNYDIRMENVAGRIQVTNRNGHVEVRMPKPPTDMVEINNERGGVELVLPPNSAFEIDASSDRGNAETEFPGLSPSGRDRERRFEGRVGSGGPRIRLRTTYDDVMLRKGQ